MFAFVLTCNEDVVWLPNNIYMQCWYEFAEIAIKNCTCILLHIMLMVQINHTCRQLSPSILLNTWSLLLQFE